MEQLLQMTFAFFKIGLFSIGGGYAIIPLIQEQVVERFHWVSQKVFTDVITISQMTPGPLAVNTSTFIGIQIGGLLGAILATAGCVISGICISAFLYVFFQKHRRSEYVFGVLNGLKATSLGLIISAAFTIILLAFTGSSQLTAFRNLDWLAVGIFLLSFLLVRKWRINPILCIVITGVIGGIVY